MGFVRVTAAVLLAVVLLCGALTAGGFENSGVGTKARGMGGAFRAVADDWTAAFYNPAGYAQIPDNQFGANAGFLHLRDQLTPDYQGINMPAENGMYNGLTVYNTHAVLSMPSAGFVVRLPFWGETVMGLSAYQPFDQNIRWDLFRPERAYNDSAHYRTYDEQFLNNLDVVAFQVTAAREFTPDKLSAGVGLQVLRGDLVFKNVYLRDNPFQPLSYRPYDHIPEYANNNGNGWGFGLKAGLLWKQSEKLNVGFTASLPFTLTLKGTSHLTFVMPHNPSVVTFSQDYPVGSVGYLFAAGQDINLNADFEAKLKLPPSVGMGLSYAVHDKVTVALDAEYTLWSRFEGLSFTYSNWQGLTGAADSAAVRDFFASNLNNPADWKNTIKLAMGSAYEFNQYVTFLGGVSLDQAAVKDETVIPQFVDAGSRFGLSGGVLVHIQRWDLGLTTSYSRLSSVEVTGLTDTDGDGVNDNFPGDYKGGTYETILSFNYRY
ncbi:MAG: outer membrane protein transport protein [Candidatus Zixiibacteriota bacterium]